MDEYIEYIDEVAVERILGVFRTQKKPKFRINRVPEELRMVKVHLDIQYKEYMIREEFDWNLNDQHVSPMEFIERLVNQLGFGEVKQLHEQLLFQLMEYSEKHSFALPQIEYVPPPKKIQSEKKKPVNRIVRWQSTAKLTRLSFGLNKKCSNCEHMNMQSGQYCKKCKLPFSVLEAINCSDPITKACLVFYEVVARKCTNPIEVRRLVKDDFSSLYILKAKLYELSDGSSVVEDVFQEFMEHKDNPDLLTIVNRHQRGRQPKKVQTKKVIKEEQQIDEEEQQDDQAEQDDEDDDNEEENDEDNQEENSDEDGESKQQSEQQQSQQEEQSDEQVSEESRESSEIPVPRTRVRTRRLTQEENVIQRRSIRKRR